MWDRRECYAYPKFRADCSPGRGIPIIGSPNRCGALALALVSLLAAAAASAQTRDGQWRTYGGDSAASRYAPLDQIDKSQRREARDRVATGRTLDSRRPRAGAADARRAQFRGTPLKVGDALYSPNGVGYVEAFDPGTGKTLWVEPPLEPGAERVPRRVDARHRLLERLGRDAAPPRSAHANICSRSIRKPASRTRTSATNGRVYLSEGMGPDMRYTWTGAPLVIGDVVVLGMSPFDEFANKEATRSDVRAYDVRTGKLRWQFHVIPQKGEFGVETWENGSWEYTGHSPVWSTFSADTELGYLYMPVTAPTSDMYGGHRLGDNLYSQSIVCVEAATGKRVWHFQTVHHDLWDYRPAGGADAHGHHGRRPADQGRRAAHEAGIRVRVRPRDGRARVADRRAARAAVERAGRAHVADAADPDEAAGVRSPGRDEENLIDFTPELRAEALEILKRYTTGPLFTPPDRS